MKIGNPLNSCFICLILCLTGCVGGPTKDFYKPTGDLPRKPHKGEVALIESADLGNDVVRYNLQGYRIMGTSDYMGKFPEMIELKKQAKRVGASLVVFSAKHMQTLSGVRSFSLPNPPQTIQSQTHGNVYGYGGSASYQGTTTTVVPGGYSHYQVPYAIDRFEVHA